MEYLVRIGWSEDMSEDIASAYLDNDIDGVREYAKTLEDDEHNYEDEIVSNVRDWQKESGEVDY